MPTANSDPSAPIQPTGPAYHPRSKGSSARISASASSALLDLQLVAQRVERLPDADPDVVVLGAVFLAPEQLITQLGVVRLRGAAGPGPGYGLAP